MGEKFISFTSNRKPAAERRRKKQEDNATNQREYFLSRRVNNATKSKNGVNDFLSSVPNVRMSKAVPINRSGKIEAFLDYSKSHTDQATFRSGGQATSTLPFPSVEMRKSQFYRVNAVDTVGETIVVRFLRK